MVPPPRSGFPAPSADWEIDVAHSLFESASDFRGSPIRGRQKRRKEVTNYTSKAPITSATLLSNGAAFYTGNPAAAGTNPNFYVAGTGLTYVAQNKNNTFANANGSNLRMRNQNVELGATAGTTSQGITYLGYTTLSQ